MVLINIYYISINKCIFSILGFIITNSTTHKDEAFELITMFIDTSKPFLHDANSFITVR